MFKESKQLLLLLEDLITFSMSVIFYNLTQVDMERKLIIDNACLSLAKF